MNAYIWNLAKVLMNVLQGRSRDDVEKAERTREHRVGRRGQQTLRAALTYICITPCARQIASGKQHRSSAQCSAMT